MSKKVVVVGAGPAGIHAASRLRQRGFTDISIFEAGPAIGGRCITRMMHGGNVPVEAGFVANISAQNALTDLVVRRAGFCLNLAVDRELIPCSKSENVRALIPHVLKSASAFLHTIYA